MLTKLHCVLKCGHNIFGTVTSGRGLRFSMIENLVNEAFFLAFMGSQIYLFYTEVEKHALAKTF